MEIRPVTIGDLARKWLGMGGQISKSLARSNNDSFKAPG
jgi:hypothetical protein